MRKTRLTFIVLIICSLLQILRLDTPVYACSPNEPDYWYVGFIEVPDANLPDGITVMAHKVASSLDYLYPAGDLPSVRIQNDSAISIYLLERLDLRDLAEQELLVDGMALPSAH